MSLLFNFHLFVETSLCLLISNFTPLCSENGMNSTPINLLWLFHGWPFGLCAWGEYAFYFEAECSVDGHQIWKAYSAVQALSSLLGLLPDSSELHWEWMRAAPAVTTELSASPSLLRCFTKLRALLIGTCILITVVSSWWSKPFIIIKCLYRW